MDRDSVSVLAFSRASEYNEKKKRLFLPEEAEKGMEMKFVQRRERVLRLLEHNELLTIGQLVEQLGVSEATIRRDVKSMEATGDLRRCWGGVRRVDTPESLRQGTLRTPCPPGGHCSIGQLAAAQLRDNELIFIGSGTTTLAMIPYIQSRNIHVITNGIPQLEALHRRRIQALLLCGFFKEYSRSVVGKETVEMLRAYRFDRAFLGANGLDERLCPLSADEYEDAIKTLCIRQSRSTYLMVTGEKFHRTAYYTIPEQTAREVEIITDQPPFPSPHWRDHGGACIGRTGLLLNE